MARTAKPQHYAAAYWANYHAEGCRALWVEYKRARTGDSCYTLEKLRVLYAQVNASRRNARLLAQCFGDRAPLDLDERNRRLQNWLKDRQQEAS